jgi:hypothetical protein
MGEFDRRPPWGARLAVIGLLAIGLFERYVDEMGKECKLGAGGNRLQSLEQACDVFYGLLACQVLAIAW